MTSKRLIEDSESRSAPTLSAPAVGPWRRALREIARDQSNRVVFITTTLVVAFGYSVLLPFAYTQRVSLANWHYLDARLVAFAVAFGVTIGLVISLQVYAMRRIIRQRSAAITGLAAIGGLLPSFLCCSPIVPTLLSIFGASAATSYRSTGTVQYFFATQQNLILSLSLVFVVATALWSFHKVAMATCFTQDSCAPNVATAEIHNENAAL